MKCLKCGTEFEGNFCPNCGSPAQKSPPAPGSDSGHNIKICLNCGERLLEKAQKCPSCNAPAKDFPVVNSNDTGRIAQIRADAPHTVYKKGFWQRFAEQANEINRQKQDAKANAPLSKKQRITENRRNGIACCPKCGSTSITANKKGFGIGKAVVGAWAAGPIGLVAGNIGARKVWVTCLNCGHRWKM